MKVKLVRSKIGCTPNQRRNLQALGLKKLNSVRELPEEPNFLGMVDKVKHLVEVQKA
ncbi:MAG: 50S ribosomal protein L30 [Desulfovermiculus sp.]